MDEEGQIPQHPVIVQGHQPGVQDEQVNNNPIVHYQPVEVNPPPNQNHLAVNQPASHNHLAVNNAANQNHLAINQPANQPANQNQPVVVDQHEDQAANHQAGGHPFDHPPALWIDYLETLLMLLIAVAADTFLIASRESLGAFEASREAFDILQEVHEVWVRLAAIDAPKAETALPALIRAYEQSAEVSNRAVRAWDVVTTRLAAPAGVNNAYPDAHLLAVQQDNGVLPHDN
ncbi:hypothetical protein B0H65DRAFT_566032 [Neurospora tetraspora]|uniref:Uncharacterized protein n=1 Tax=Neurospora tetraspora TaxID=94610 RepID=A0AAE0J159_9PEZI|nr:hypothetical protein B0H65DRAFT_566032 [Neurospora tetraspora]